MLSVLLLMGLPGSGKSTFRKNLYGDVIVCSADAWHETKEGYHYLLEEAKFAHRYSFRKFVQTLQEVPHPYASDIRSKFLVVDATNTTLLELAPYVRAAMAYGRDPVIRYFPITVEEAVKRNQHAVPLEVIRLMAENIEKSLQSWPKDWPYPTEVWP